MKRTVNMKKFFLNISISCWLLTAIAAPVTAEDNDVTSAKTIQNKITAKSKIFSYDIHSVEEGSNYLEVKVSNENFKLKRTTDTEYVVEFPSSKVVAGIEAEKIVPRNSGEIRSVRLVENTNSVALRIFTKPGTFLKAEQFQDKLLVAAVHSEIDFKEIKAQEATSEEDDLEAQLEQELSETGSELFESKYTGRLISLDLQETDIDNALRIIAEVSNLNIIASDDVTGKVTLRLQDVPWDQALDVILKTNGLDMVREGNVVRIAPLEKLRSEREALKEAQAAEEELEPLRVRYIRISYARASEMQAMIENVLTERGSVTFDERTNQLIIKDIARGLDNAQQLVAKLDLRTPQVLIESQIVEASKTFSRNLGSQLGFNFLRNPVIGNALPFNFPNTAEIGGSALDAAGNAAGNVTEFANGESSALSLLFGSADGSKSLSARLTQAEAEGVARIVSRPSVAVTNNTPAVIRSVQKIRIKLPAGGGVNIGVGAGAGAGGGNVATEVIEVGIVLNVTAQASPDYFVLMDIDAKSSTLGAIGSAVDGIPPEIERSMTSSVLISSGQTFAMGGIYRVSENNDIAGVPFFKDIPVLGHFFRSTTLLDSDEELLFFLTPRIIEGSFDDAALEDTSL